MLPIYDENPTKGFIFVTHWLILINGAVFLWQMTSALGFEANIFTFGFIPARFFEAPQISADAGLIWPLTIVSSMFMHGGIGHILGNMLFLWIFGNNVEDALGTFKFIVFYLACGAAAALAQGWIDPTSTIPLVGASGAISGVLGSYLLLYPVKRVHVIIPAIIIFYRMIVPAYFLLLIYFAMQVAFAFLSDTSGGGVAFWAHIGGFIAGVILTPLLKKPNFPLFDTSPN